MKNLNLSRPVLTTSDKLKIISYANYYGYQAIIDTEKKKALVIRDDETVGFIQKNENNRLFVHYKDDLIHNIGEHANLIAELEKYNLVPLPDNDNQIEEMINMQSLKIITV